MKRRKQHGGARKGAGAKPKGDAARTKPIPVKVSPTELDGLRARAVEHGISLAAFVRAALGIES